MVSEKYRSSKADPPSFHVLEEMFLISIEGRKSTHLKGSYMDQKTVAQTPRPRTKWDCQYLTGCPSESEVAQSCLILCDPMHYSLPGSSIQGIFQARVLEWVAIFFSRESSWRSNLGLPHCRQTLYQLSHRGSSSVIPNL